MQISTFSAVSQTGGRVNSVHAHFHVGKYAAMRGANQLHVKRGQSRGHVHVSASVSVHVSCWSAYLLLVATRLLELLLRKSAEEALLLRGRCGVMKQTNCPCVCVCVFVSRAAGSVICRIRASRLRLVVESRV